MAVTVAGKNYSQISSCDTTSSGGTWSGGSQDTDNYKEGSASLSNVMKASGLNSWTFTPSSSVDMSGTKHLRIWFLDAAAGLLATQAAGGIQLGISDGSNTGYWYLGGSDTYNGGWVNLCVDTSSSVQSGTKPTNMAVITSIIVRINQTSGGKNFDNIWIDNLNLCDGLIAYGDDSGGYFNFDDIFSGDNNTSLGIGIVRKIGGVYYGAGSIEFGDSASTNSCKFQAKSQVFIFEDRPVNSSLYAFDIVDNGTGTTEFILGDKSGTKGIQGCAIRSEDATQSAKFALDGKTDTDVDNFKLYSSVFYGASSIAFAADATNVEVIGCSFESCGQVDVQDCETTGCFFISTSDTDAALLWNENINISNCAFIGNTIGAGIEMPSSVGTPYAYDGLSFSGNTYDVLNSSGSAISINKNNGSDPTTYEGSTVTFLGTSVTTTITVKDIDSQTAIQYARVLVWAADGTGPFCYDASVTSITQTGGTATVTQTGHGLVDDDYVYLEGATNSENYNGVKQITKLTDNTYTFSIDSGTASPATGTILAKQVMFHGETDVDGEISDTRELTSDQPLTGKVRYYGGVTKYKTAPVSFTVDKDSGYTTTVFLIPE